MMMMMSITKMMMTTKMMMSDGQNFVCAVDVGRMSEGGRDR